MRRFMVLLIMLLLASQTVLAGTDPINYQNGTAKLNGVNIPYQQVTIDLNDKNVKINTALGWDSIAKPESFASLVKRKDAYAAINANYFDAYKTMEPIGAIMSKGRFVHLEGDAPSLVVTQSGEVSISQHRIRIGLSTEDYSFELHQVNLKPNSQSLLIITPERGESIDLPKGTSLEITNGKITKINTDLKKAAIPKGGYLVFFGSESYLGKRAREIFKVGQEIKLKNYISIPLVFREEGFQSMGSKLNGISYGGDQQAQALEKGKKFNVWKVNDDPVDQTSIYLFTKKKGDGIKAKGGYALYILNGVISKVDFNVQTINTSEADYVIYLASQATTANYVKDNFPIGNRIAFYDEKTKKIDTDNILKKAIIKNIDLSDPLAVISAGPSLILNNDIVFDPDTSGFKEDKIRVNRAVRSAVGITKDNKLLLITASNITMSDLAELMKSIGAVNAINLDGGASSALYYKGNMVRRAGRNLHTILTINYLSEEGN